MEGNEAILGPEVISGGVGLEPAFNHKKKDISRRNVTKEIRDHDISTILVYFCSDCKMCSAMKITKNGTF